MDEIIAVGGMKAGREKKEKLQRLLWTSFVHRFLSTSETTGQLDTVPTAQMGEMGGGDVQMLRK